MKIQNVAVIGTGILGTQIAIQAACHKYRVTAYDIDDTAFEKVLERLKIRMKNSSRKPTLPWAQMIKGSRLVKKCKTLQEAVAEADLVIEAVPEDLNLKRKVFKQLDLHSPRKALLATNSSSIPISRIEKVTTRPEKCLNIHFYALDQGRNIVDVMGGTRTPAGGYQNRQGLGPIHRLYSSHGEEGDPWFLLQSSVAGDQTGSLAYVGWRVCGFQRY